MSVLSMDEELNRAKPRTPFSNGFEGEHWMGEWCDRCRHDADESCPLLLVAFLGRTPAAWTETRPGGLADRYTCTEWEQR